MASGGGGFLAHKWYDKEEPPKVEVISAQTAFDKIKGEGWTYLDVRTPDAYAKSHAEGAVNIALKLNPPDGSDQLIPNPQFWEQVNEKFPDKEAGIVAACFYGRKGSEAAEKLQEAGFKVKQVQDGLSGWTEAGLPVWKAPES